VRCRPTYIGPSDLKSGQSVYTGPYGLGQRSNRPVRIEILMPETGQGRSKRLSGELSANGTAIPALEVHGISKSFGGKTVLYPFDLTVLPGEIHMIVGQNGSGKSTLIKVLSGYHRPEGGSCAVAGQPLPFGVPAAAQRLGLRFVHQDLGLIDDASVLDNMAFVNGYPGRFGRINRNQLRAQTVSQLRAVGLDLNPETKVGMLRPAQRTGIAVGRALNVDAHRANIIVLDEPTASLPASDVQALHVMLRSAADAGLAVIYVTHHLDEVDVLGDYVHVLRDGRFVLDKPVNAVDRSTLVHRLLGSKLESVARRAAESSAPIDHPAVALSVRGLVCDSVHNVDLSVSQGEIVGVYGLTGSGRESLLGAIFGALPRSSGEVSVGHQVVPNYRPRAAIRAGMAYVPADRRRQGGFTELLGTENLTIADLAPFWRQGLLRLRDERRYTDEMFMRLDVRPVDGARLPLKNFSGGNQQKIVMGKWLRTAAKVYLLDDPTQGVDVGAKAGLHCQVLDARERGTATLISSTDEDELATLCDRVLVMQRGRIAIQLGGRDVTAPNIARAFHKSEPTAER
jgi:ribose transport system ATP-binding protein